MDEDIKAARQRLADILKGYDPTALGRLASKIVSASREAIAETELQIIRHRTFGRTEDANNSEAWLVQHQRDVELGRALMEISAMADAQKLVADYMAGQR